MQELKIARTSDGLSDKSKAAEVASAYCPSSTSSLTLDRTAGAFGFV